MSSNKPPTARKFLYSLNMNKIKGRMLILPKKNANTKIDFLLVSGQKYNLEKWFALAESLSNYGNVTMPDLPGIGGMGSFYAINDKPTIDNYADYLSAFIKLRYRRKKIVLIGISFGFMVAVRMLQKYPDLEKKIKVLISISGHTHIDDLKLSGSRVKFNLLLSKIFANSMTAQLYKSLIYDEYVFKLINRKIIKLENRLDTGLLDKLIKSEIRIQKKCDARTQFFLMNQILKLDLGQKNINLPVWALVKKNDKHLDNNSVRMHMEAIFSKYHEIQLSSHARLTILGYADSSDANRLIPYRLKLLFNRQNK